MSDGVQASEMSDTGQGQIRDLRGGAARTADGYMGAAQGAESGLQMPPPLPPDRKRMTDQDIIDTIAESLRDGNPDDNWLWADEARDVLTALRERYEIVELPKHPTEVLIGGEPEGVYISDRLDELNITISGTVSIYADEAPALAAALLAAAEEGK